MCTRTEDERRLVEGPLSRMETFESNGTFVLGAEDRTGYEQPSIHLNVCAARTNRFIRALGAPHGDPVQPGPNPSVLVRRFLFHSHVRRPGQSVSQFAAELKQLSDHCGFGSALDDTLRDRLVCGLEDEAVQRRLLEEETPLSFNRALDISLEMEAAGHVKDQQNGHGLRTAAVQHVDRDIEHLSVVKDKVPHEQSWNPGLDQKDPEPLSIKEEKKALLTTMKGERPQCLMQQIPVLESLADFKQLWAVKGHVPPEQKDSRPGLDQDQDQEDPDPPGTEEKPESLYAVEEGEQHQSLILVLECPADIQQLWAVKEDHPPVQKGPRPGLDQDQALPDPEEEQEEPCAGQGLKDAAINCGGPDTWDLEECGGPEPNMNPDHIMNLSKIAAPNSGCYFSESKRRKVTTNSSLEKHKKTTTGGRFVRDTSTCHSLRLRARKNAISFQDVRGLNKQRCIKCGKRFQYYSWLKRHMTVHTREKPKTSSVCEKRVSYTHHLKTHTEVHKLDKPFRDSAGEKSLSPKIYLRKCVINHTEERKFVCSVCDKIFVSRLKLNDHTRVHTGEKPYGCPQCGRRFYVKSSVKRHMYVHKEEKPYGCPQCGRRFYVKSSVKRHMYVHKGEKAYDCSNCGRSFHSKLELATHMRMHTVDKPYSCSDCDVRFCRSFSLKRHMMLHTGEKPYECSVCEKRFRQRVHLSEHMTKYHRTSKICQFSKKGKSLKC